MNRTIIEYIKKEAIALPKNNIGLFTGRAGCCLALYIINRQVNDAELKKIADSLLEETIEVSSTCEDLSLDKGLTGIGLAINYLVSEGYIEGNLDEVLSDIDALLYKTLKQENVRLGISCTSGLIGYLVYLVERISCSTNHISLYHKINEASLRDVINKLEVVLSSQFSGITKDIYTSIICNYPILFIYLKKAIELDIYSKKIYNIVKFWSTYLPSYIPYYNINKLYLIVALKYLDMTFDYQLFNKYIQTLIFLLDEDELYKEIDTNIMNINEGVFFVEILLQSAKKLFANTDFGNKCAALYLKIHKGLTPLYDNSLETMRTTKNFNLQLINGFLGVEIINILYPSLFKINTRRLFFDNSTYNNCNGNNK